MRRAPPEGLLSLEGKAFRLCTNQLNRRRRVARLVGLYELATAALIVGISCINAALSAVVGLRSGDRRFGAVVGAHALLVILGAVWVWGQLPVSPPSWAVESLPVLGIVLVAAVLFLASTLWSRSP